MHFQMIRYVDPSFEERSWFVPKYLIKCEAGDSALEGVLHKFNKTAISCRCCRTHMRPRRADTGCKINSRANSVFF